MHQPHQLQSFHTSNKLHHDSLSNPPPLKWTFRNSPSLISAITHGGVEYDEEGYAIAKSVPTLSFPRGPAPRPFVAIPSPFEASDPSTLIAHGTWVAYYGEVHGCELIHIQSRKIDERDLTGKWGEEESLAYAVTPAAQDVHDIFMLPSRPALLLSSEDVEIGNTIIEATKMTGSYVYLYSLQPVNSF
jgi:hypothetical protein